MSGDLITRMAEAAYKRRMDRWREIGGYFAPSGIEAWTDNGPEFQAAYRAEMEMLRDMVLAESREPDPQGDRQARREPGKAAPVLGRSSVRKRRLSLF